MHQELKTWDIDTIVIKEIIIVIFSYNDID